jgi:hypothetical protein
MVDPDDAGYRSLMQGASNDMPSIQHERALELSNFLYERDGWAARLIELPRKAMLSGGIGFQPTSEKKDERKIVQWLLDDWWETGIRPFRDRFLGSLGNSLLDAAQVNGELTLPFFVYPENGMIEFGYIDARNIETVNKQPGNAMEFKNILLKRDPQNPDRKREFDILQQQMTGDWKGECVHRALYAPVNARRGRPYIIRFIDFLDLFGQFVFNEGERAVNLQRFLLDVTLNNKSPEECAAWLRATFPNGFTKHTQLIRAHNSDEIWNYKTPDLKAGDSSAMAEMMKANALGPTGWPLFAFAVGGNINNTVSREMMVFAEWEVATVGAWVDNVLKEIASFKLWVSQKYGQQTPYGRLTPEMDLGFKVNRGKAFPRDEVQASATLSQIVGSVNIAMDSGLCSLQTAQEAFLVGLRALGINKSVEQINKELDAEEPGDKFQDFDEKSETSPEDILQEPVSPVGEKTNYGEREKEARRRRKGIYDATTHESFCNGWHKLSGNGKI